jgi:hypothetical protein
MGPQASLSPSSYALPFWEMMVSWPRLPVEHRHAVDVG